MTKDNLMEAVRVFGERYGPYAFGMLSLLLIWYTIVAPQLEERRMDWDHQHKCLEQMRDIQADQKQISKSLQDTATVLERVVLTLQGPRNEQ